MPDPDIKLEMGPMPRLCNECKHYEIYQKLDEEKTTVELCLHEKAKANTSLVAQHYYHCSVMRSDKLPHCGPEGKLFKERHGRLVRYLKKKKIL